MARKKGSKDYPLETRREAIRLFYEEGLTRAEVTRKLGIADPKRVSNLAKALSSGGASLL